MRSTYEVHGTLTWSIPGGKKCVAIVTEDRMKDPEFEVVEIDPALSGAGGPAFGINTVDRFIRSFTFLPAAIKFARRQCSTTSGLRERGCFAADAPATEVGPFSNPEPVPTPNRYELDDLDFAARRRQRRQVQVEEVRKAVVISTADLSIDLDARTAVDRAQMMDRCPSLNFDEVMLYNPISATGGKWYGIAPDSVIFAVAVRWGSHRERANPKHYKDYAVNAKWEAIEKANELINQKLASGYRVVAVHAACSWYSDKTIPGGIK